MKVLLDTSVLTALIYEGYGKLEACKVKIQQLRNAGHLLVIAPQCLYEFYSVATRPSEVKGLGLTPEHAIDYWLSFQSQLVTLPDPSQLVDIQRELLLTYQVRGRQAHDTRLVAWMQAHNVPSIFTLNTKDFVRFVPAIQLV